MHIYLVKYKEGLYFKTNGNKPIDHLSSSWPTIFNNSVNTDLVVFRSVTQFSLISVMYDDVKNISDKFATLLPKIRLLDETYVCGQDTSFQISFALVP